MRNLKKLGSLNLGVSQFEIIGSVVKIVGLSLEVKGVIAPVGSRCQIQSGNGSSVFADIVGFRDGLSILQALGGVDGIEPNSEVVVVSRNKSLSFSEALVGCVIDPMGNVLIGNDVERDISIDIDRQPISISDRGVINTRFETGVKVIDMLLPLGFGQRIGLFAGTGVGKSVMMGMITRFSDADIVIVGLIGERGREVSEFAQETLSEEARKKTIIVAAPADYSPILRMQGAEVATAIAEHYRDKGLNVLLLMDSVTRYAQAQREVALSAGEAPATKGYPASVFAKLPFLIERAGAAKCGSITAIYTVLIEGDDTNDPIGDAARGVLDGHIVLSRKRAESGIYPAVDVPKSISRLSKDLLSDSDFKKIRSITALYSILDENADMISLGMIDRGKNLLLDKAMGAADRITDLVRQDINVSYTIKNSDDMRDNLIDDLNLVF
ncbi:FliI/YscN family ATPase [Photobacterium kishitanii]|uniref:FliI/YscN family ATPase n=1 Tax=Photobacterium kishitanii TaxID=318456 RepID=UPI0015E7A44F|nr:FliI/YscN family ATPase [Photobacterium kishitanii]